MGKVIANTGLEGLLELVKTLRGKDGCPWDRAQTAEKIKVYLIEEAYEVLDAIDSGDPEEVCAELGDLLFHIVFLARIYEESGSFDIEHVITGILKKMIRRHPHVFGESKVSGVGDVKSQWQEIKKAEKKGDVVHGLFDSVPVALPALLRAYRVGERAERIGLGQRGMEVRFQQVEAEYEALKKHAVQENMEGATERFGTLLFSLVRLGRELSIHPENALSQEVSRFLERFSDVENKLKTRGQTFDDLSPEERAELWEDLDQSLKPEKEKSEGDHG